MRRLILASASPRRRDLLERAGYEFTVIPLKVSEIPDENLNADQRILDIARRKAKACADLLQNQGAGSFVLLAADTEVVLDDELLGKPDDHEHAVQTLIRLSGREHLVKTGLWLIDETGKEASHLETTVIRFKNLDLTQIREYVATGDPMDKAGSYAIQGGAGKFVESMIGDFENVVGLPIKAFTELLQRESWKVR